MDGLLTAVQTVKRDERQPSERKDDSLKQNISGDVTESTDSDPASADHILAVLKSKPDRDGLLQILATLDPSSKESGKHLDIRVPSPTTAQILQVLVSTTIPDHWDSLNSKSRDGKSKNGRTRAALLRCLSSVAGISSLVAQLRTLIAASRSSQQAEGSSNEFQIRDILTVLSCLLRPNDFLFRLYQDISNLYGSETKRRVAWQELVSLVAASRVLSNAAEALTFIKNSSDLASVSWVGEGVHYASWLSQGICHMASTSDPGCPESWKAIASLASRALSLGYTDQIVRDIYYGLLVGENQPKQFASLLDNLRPTAQIAVVEAIFRDVEKKFFPEEISGWGIHTRSRETVNGVATLCSMVVGNREQLASQIIEWLSTGHEGSIRTNGLRRALIVNFARSKESMNNLLTKSLGHFSDKFSIKYAPIRSQKANAQVVLLAAGYLSRLNEGMVRAVGRSGVFLNAVSNRLAAASTDARFLGMIVGTAISKLIEPPGKAMTFDLEEMESDDARWYLDLVNTNDDLGSLDLIKTAPAPPKTQKPAKSPASSTHPKRRANMPQSKIVSIEEVEDSEEEDKDDTQKMPYEDSDSGSDSEDDPTLFRKKPTPPVYIRDLTTYLRDTEDIDRHNLGITSAPSLIRRKNGFGTELIDNITELALIIVGLQNEGKQPNFHEYRLQSMIALIIAQPVKMGNWFSAMFFDGDISQTQRSAILTALGLSARELAGHGEEDAHMLRLPEMPETSFPSKTLPPSFERLYQTDESPVASLTRQLSHTSLQPLAANAADAATGPNALKVRTFSSRMEVEKKRQQREAQKQKSTVKDLHRILADGFFYPLKGRFDVMMMQFSSSTAPSFNPFFIPHLLTLFLQTITLILTTSGPHTPTLPTLTQETLSLILSLHTRTLADEPTILSALLSLFLAIVDLNIAAGTTGEERLVTQFAAQVLELRDWAGEVFDRVPAGTDEKDPTQQVRTLAAGVMVKLGEVMERYQGRLMGVNVGFKY